MAYPPGQIESNRTYPPPRSQISRRKVRHWCSTSATLMGMATRETYINHDDVEQYVRNTLPYNETDDWDINGIANELIDACPDAIGFHPDLLDMPITATGPAGAWLDHHLDPDRYQTAIRRWQMTHDDAATGNTEDLRNLTATELDGRYNEAAAADDINLIQSIRALRGEPPLAHLHILYRQEDGGWREWDTADYEFGPTRRHALPSCDELTDLLHDYVDDCYAAGEWSLEARDAATGVVLRQSEAITSQGCN
jgi:hypothetical protein